MAARAFAFAEEYFPPTSCIAGRSSRRKLPLKRPQVADQGAGLFFTESAKSRHAGSGYTVRNDAGQLRIREMPDFATSGNVDRFVASTAIQSVTASARGVVRFSTHFVGSRGTI